MDFTSNKYTTLYTKSQKTEFIDSVQMQQLIKSIQILTHPEVPKLKFLMLFVAYL